VNLSRLSPSQNPHPRPRGCKQPPYRLTQGGGAVTDFQVAQSIAMTAATQTVDVLGGPRASSTPSPVADGAYQPYTLEVTVTGSPTGQTASATVPLVLRALGDITADGTVNASDKLEMNKALNGLATLPGITLRDLDLSGDGALINAEDKLIINQVLNGLAVP